MITFIIGLVIGWLATVAERSVRRTFLLRRINAEQKFNEAVAAEVLRQQNLTAEWSGSNVPPRPVSPKYTSPRTW